MCHKLREHLSPLERISHTVARALASQLTDVSMKNSCMTHFCVAPWFDAKLAGEKFSILLFCCGFERCVGVCVCASVDKWLEFFPKKFFALCNVVAVVAAFKFYVPIYCLPFIRRLSLWRSIINYCVRMVCGCLLFHLSLRQARISVACQNQANIAGMNATMRARAHTHRWQLAGWSIACRDAARWKRDGTTHSLSLSLAHSLSHTPTNPDIIKYIIQTIAQLFPAIIISMLLIIIIYNQHHTRHDRSTQPLSHSVCSLSTAAAACMPRTDVWP